MWSILQKETEQHQQVKFIYKSTLESMATRSAHFSVVLADTQWDLPEFGNFSIGVGLCDCFFSL